MSRFVFAGTPEFAARHLAALLNAGFVPAAVYTQPDRPAGRGQQLHASPVKQLAQQCHLPVVQVNSLRDANTQQQFRELAPDLFIVVAYGLLLPQSILDIPRHGCINVHASLLPRWRGAAPIQRAIEAGDAETGTALMRMEAGLDTGPVITQASVAIEHTDTSASLHDKLAEAGAKLLVKNFPDLLCGNYHTSAQSSAGICYAHKLEKTEAIIDWQQDAQTLDRKIRAFNPFPICNTTLHTEVVKIYSATPDQQACTAKPGTIVAVSNAAITVACQHGALHITEMQFPGGKRLTVKDILQSKRRLLDIGTRFGIFT